MVFLHSFQLSGNGFISPAGVTAAPCRPSKIAFTMSCASGVTQRLKR